MRTTFRALGRALNVSHSPMIWSTTAAKRQKNHALRFKLFVESRDVKEDPKKHRSAMTPKMTAFTILVYRTFYSSVNNCVKLKNTHIIQVIQHINIVTRLNRPDYK